MNTTRATSESRPPVIRRLSRSRLPQRWKEDLAGVLVPQRAIHRRIDELACSIQKDYQDRDLVIVALLTGTVLFLADLIRRLPLPLRLDFVGVSSYRESTTPGELVYTKELHLDVHGRDVLLVDDILDTGLTLQHVTYRLKPLKPRSLKVCVLIEKTARRLAEVKADYVGFIIPDYFVVGYGLDYAERFRNLPFIGVMKEMFNADRMELEGGEAP